MQTRATGSHAHAFAHLARLGRFVPIDAHPHPDDFTDDDRAEFARMELHQQAFNALSRAQRELLSFRSDYTNAIAQAQKAIAAMQALALIDGRA